MFDYDAERLRSIILETAKANIPGNSWTWLNGQLGLTNTSAINTAFALMSRKTGKEEIQINTSEADLIGKIKPGFAMKSWTADRLGRLCLLLHLDTSSQERYFKTVENLFLAAEITELVALYSSLSLLAYPDIWKLRCAEGIRSNMGSVLEAIMYENPYPANYLDEGAWNQLVMKAFFTDKDVKRIYGFDRRANAELARILADYAHERWAAGRSVNPQLWRSTARFLDSGLKSDLQRVLLHGEPREQMASVLALYHSNSAEGKELLRDYQDLVSAIEKEELTWENL